jgi:hypothetical protein
MCEVYPVLQKHIAFHPDDLKILHTTSSFCSYQYMQCRNAKTWEEQVSYIYIEVSVHSLVTVCSISTQTKLRLLFN